MHSLVSVQELLYIVSYVLSLSIISTVFICITCTQLFFSLDVEYMEVLGYQALQGSWIDLSPCIFMVVYSCMSSQDNEMQYKFKRQLRAMRKELHRSQIYLQVVRWTQNIQIKQQARLYLISCVFTWVVQSLIHKRAVRLHTARLNAYTLDPS